MLWHSLAAGAVAGWGFNAFDTNALSLYWFAPVFTLGGFCALGYILKNTARPAFAAYLFGIAYHTVSLSWVGSAFDYTTIPWVKYILSPVGGMYLGLQFPLAVWLSQRCIPGSDQQEQSGAQKSSWIPALHPRIKSGALSGTTAFAVAFSLLDLLRTLHPLLFPWNPMGFVAGNFCLSSIRWFGIFGLSFIMLLFSQLPYLSRKWQIGISVLVGVLVVDHYYYQKQPTTFTNICGRIVQPCIDQNFKWQMEKFEENVTILRDLSNLPISCNPRESGDPKDRTAPLGSCFRWNDNTTQPLQFILWPESALPVYFTPDVESLVNLVPKDVPLIVGHVHVTRSLDPGSSTYGLVRENNITHTSLSLLTQEKGMISTYNKRHLVPFGEYVPFAFLKSIIPFITDQRMDMVPGSKKQILDLCSINLPNAHVLICYESLFPQTIKGYQPWIIGVSNDAWFGTTYGPYQHLRWNQIRCLENNIPMIRSTNHGISAVIDSYGRIIKALNLNQCDVIDHLVPASTGPSLYNQIMAKIL